MGSKVYGLSDKEVKGLAKTIVKRARGYSTSEMVEEYAQSDGELVLVKRKVTTKEVPPDITAIKFLLGEQGQEREIGLDELLKKKEQLIELFKGEINGNYRD